MKKIGLLEFFCIEITRYYYTVVLLFFSDGTKFAYTKPGHFNLKPEHNKTP